MLQKLPNNKLYSTAYLVLWSSNFAHEVKVVTPELNYISFKNLIINTHDMHVYIRAYSLLSGAMHVVLYMCMYNSLDSVYIACMCGACCAIAAYSLNANITLHC
jgi:hypothetical protein